MSDIPKNLNQPAPKPFTPKTAPAQPQGTGAAEGNHFAGFEEHQQVAKAQAEPKPVIANPGVTVQPSAANLKAYVNIKTPPTGQKLRVGGEGPTTPPTGKKIPAVGEGPTKPPTGQKLRVGGEGPIKPPPSLPPIHPSPPKSFAYTTADVIRVLKQVDLYANGLTKKRPDGSITQKELATYLSNNNLSKVDRMIAETLRNHFDEILNRLVSLTGRKRANGLSQKGIQLLAKQDGNPKTFTAQDVFGIVIKPKIVAKNETVEGPTGNKRPAKAEGATEGPTANKRPAVGESPNVNKKPIV